MSHEKLDRLTAERDEVVAEFEKARQEIDAKVQEKLAEAGLSDLLRNAQAELEGHRQKAQSRVDFLTGQISMLEEVLGVKSAQA